MKCFFGHKFNKWQVTDEANLHDNNHPERITGKIVVQKRDCRECGFTDVGSVSTLTPSWTHAQPGTGERN